MTRLLVSESDWLRSADPRAMLECLFPPRSEGSAPDLPRKLRLYLVACGRKKWQQIPRAGRTLLALAEQMADGWEPTEVVYDELFHLAERFAGCNGYSATVAACDQDLCRLGFDGFADADPPPAPLRAADWPVIARLALVPLFRKLPVDNWVAPHLHDADLVRDVFRHPDQPYRFHPDWRTSTAVGLARGMYESRDFSGVPALSDALEEAGCDDQAVLDHCRAAEPHVRGCWVVDLVLGEPAGSYRSSVPGRPGGTPS